MMPTYNCKIWIMSPESHETGLMAGTTEWSGMPFGFVANRLRD